MRLATHSSQILSSGPGHSNRRRPARRAERGAALLAALCFATVMAIALGSYLTVCKRSLEMSARNMHASRSVELAEAGIEDALWALNNNDWTGWSIVGTTAKKTISGFTFETGVTGQIATTITSYNGTAGARTVATTGTTSVAASGIAIARTLTCGSAPAAVFTNAIAGTTGTVKLTAAGASSVIDSYDSSAGTYASQTPGYSAILASGSTSTSAATVQLTNAQVKGYVATLSTGPSYSTSATLKGPATPGTTKIDSDRVSTSPYQPTFDIRSVSGAGTTLSTPSDNTVVTIGTAGATSASIYYSSGINMTGTTTKLRVDGPVKLVVSGSFYVGLNGGSPQIQVTNNGTLEVFAAGDIAIYGNGMVNDSGLPKRMVIYGTNQLTPPDMNTNTPFHGVIYTPNGDFKVVSNNAIYGAIVARNVVFSGTAPVLHYDMDLRNTVLAGIDTPFSISGWRETTNGN